MKTLTEHELRQLRAQVFGECTDKNWAEVKDNWSRPDAIAWLREKASQPLPTRH